LSQFISVTGSDIVCTMHYRKPSACQTSPRPTFDRKITGTAQRKTYVLLVFGLLALCFAYYEINSIDLLNENTEADNERDTWIKKSKKDNAISPSIEKELRVKDDKIKELEDMLEKALKQNMVSEINIETEDEEISNLKKQLMEDEHKIKKLEDVMETESNHDKSIENVSSDDGTGTNENKSSVSDNEEEIVADETVITTMRRKDVSNRPPKKVKRISLIGERHSGTNWIMDHLTDCFLSEELEVKDALTRFKHWFQDDAVERKEMPHVETVVVAQFRNIYQWVESMRERPHHSPQHYDKSNKKMLSWETFVTKPWSMNRVDEDEKLQRDSFLNGTKSSSMIECHSQYKYNQINSCVEYPYNENETKILHKLGAGFHGPKYELLEDGSGRPYSSIVNMRAAKIRNFLSVAEFDWVKQLLVVRYEDLFLDGTESLIKSIEELTGVNATCDLFKPQVKKKQLNLPKLQKDWMEKHVDWKAENVIGYRKHEIP